jgi:hypothetical protein
MHDRRQRAACGFEASRHVPVRGGIGREVGGREQPLEIRRRLDRVEPVALIDGRALHNYPTSVPLLQAIDKARVGRQVGKDVPDPLAHQITMLVSAQPCSATTRTMEGKV